MHFAVWLHLIFSLLRPYPSFWKSFKNILDFFIISHLMQGKLIEIHFSSAGKICGAKIQTCKHFNACHVRRSLIVNLF